MSKKKEEKKRKERKVKVYTKKNGKMIYAEVGMFVFKGKTVLVEDVLASCAQQTGEVRKQELEERVRILITDSLVDNDNGMGDLPCLVGLPNLVLAVIHEHNLRVAEIARESLNK